MTIIRRHHPLRAHTYEVLLGGRRDLLVRVADERGVMRLPRAWTDADGPQHEHDAETVFTVDAIRALHDLVDALRHRLSS